MIPLLLSLAFAQDPAPEAPAAESTAPATETPAEAAEAADTDATPEADASPETDGTPEADGTPETDGTPEAEDAPEAEAEPTDGAPAETDTVSAEEPTPTEPDSPELFTAAEEDTAPMATAPRPPKGEMKVATWSFSAEYGGSGIHDEGFDLFGDGDRIPVGGFRLGYRVLDRVEAQVGWLRGLRGAQVEVANPDGRRELAFRSAYDANRFSLGLRADLTVENAVFGYIAARGQLVVQRVRIDGDPDRTSNPDQLAETALAPGGELVGGIELRLPQEDRPLTFGVTVEMGAETVANTTFGDFGDLRSGGFVIHTGVGVRF